MTRKHSALRDPALLRAALPDALKKLDPRTQWRNPVMFVVWLGSVLTTLIWLEGLVNQLPFFVLIHQPFIKVADHLYLG